MEVAPGALPTTRPARPRAQGESEGFPYEIDRADGGSRNAQDRADFAISRRRNMHIPSYGGVIAMGGARENRISSKKITR